MRISIYYQCEVSNFANPENSEIHKIKLSKTFPDHNLRFIFFSTLTEFKKGKKSSPNLIEPKSDLVPVYSFRPFQFSSCIHIGNSKWHFAPIKRFTSKPETDTFLRHITTYLFLFVGFLNNLESNIPTLILFN